MVNEVHLTKLPLNEANASDTEAPFLDLHLSIWHGFFHKKNYDKRGNFDLT